MHVVFKTHLDVGFTDLARNVIRRYIDDFVPSSLSLSRELRAQGGDRFIWTVGSWLVWEYLEKASAKRRREMEQAIDAGDIAWHALPFTTHSELMEPSLFEYGLSLSHRLDKRFGRKTIAGKMTDVPGHTRGIVPLLARAGVQFLHIGVNPACKAPSVPPAFVWRDPASKAQVMVMYHSDYGDTTFIPGMTDALSICFTGDNKGPQNGTQVRKVFDALRRKYPMVWPKASTLDAFAKQLLTLKRSLPVVTQEIGDTWIHGTGSDPAKLAAFRELCRLRSEMLAQKADSSSAVPLDAFSRKLLMLAEHTWGLDHKVHLDEYRHFSKTAFARARRLPKFKKMESSWQEQRAYVAQAVAAIPAGPLRANAQQRLRSLRPVAIRFKKYRSNSPTVLQNKHLSLSIDPSTGALTMFRDLKNGYDWSDRRHPLFALRYEVFGQQEHDRFLAQYLRARPWWAALDFGKKGVGRVLRAGKSWSPAVSRIDRDGEHRLVLELKGHDDAVERFGSPRRFTIELDLAKHERVLNVVVQWFGKTATRVPEATWLSLKPKLSRTSRWKMHKLGARIDPTDVVRCGNRNLHGVWEGFTCTSGRRNLQLMSPDAGLVAPGEPSLLRFDNRQPSLAGGMHVNLHNSTFNNNFPLWYEDDARFRFELSVG